MTLRKRYLQARRGLRYGVKQLHNPAYPMIGIECCQYDEWIKKLEEQHDLLYKYRYSTEDLESTLTVAEAVLKEYRAKARYNKPPKRKDLIDYLRSHIEWEHIELDLRERYGHSSLNKLSHNQLYNIAENYGYMEGDD